MSEDGQDSVDVLLVEDDPGDALMTRESFAQAGKNNRFHVIPDGHEALRFLRRQGEYARAPRPGLILLDLNLPCLHGLDVTRGKVTGGQVLAYQIGSSAV
jgi:CheY-like chemotaxis protein